MSKYKSYSDKLRDPRWFDFKQEFLKWRKDAQGVPDDWCEDCGEDTEGPLHLHHTVYYQGQEPWEYELREMRLYCEECHDRIHDLERDFQAFIRTVAPHECYEFRDVLYALQAAQQEGVLKIALAHAKNAAYHIANLHRSKKPFEQRMKEMFGFKEGEE